MLNGKKIIVVMPAYNAAKTLAKTVAEIPRGVVDEILLVDDASKDRTVDLANELGLTVFLHDANFGYGRNQKTCYREAMRHGADISDSQPPLHVFHVFAYLLKDFGEGDRRTLRF